MINPKLPQAVDDLERRVRRDQLARRCGASRARRRTSSPCARHRLAAEAWAAGIYDGEIVQVPGARAGPRRGHPRRHVGREARGAEGAVRRRRRGHGHGGQLVADQRRCVRRAPRRARARCDAEPLARITARAVHGIDPDHVRDRADRGGEQGAGARRPHVGRRRLRRAQRGVRVAVARVPGGCGPSSTPTSSTSTAARSRSATRSAPRAAASSATPRTSCAGAAAASPSPRSASASGRASPSCSSGDPDRRRDAARVQQSRLRVAGSISRRSARQGQLRSTGSAHQSDRRWDSPIRVSR